MAFICINLSFFMIKSIGMLFIWCLKWSVPKTGNEKAYKCPKIDCQGKISKLLRFDGVTYVHRRTGRSWDWTEERAGGKQKHRHTTVSLSLFSFFFTSSRRPLCCRTRCQPLLWLRWVLQIDFLAMFPDWKPHAIYQQQGYGALHILFFHKNGAINVDFDIDKQIFVQ